MSLTKAVKLVAVCDKCGESVDILITKAELKILLSGFKNMTPQGQMNVDKALNAFRQRQQKLADTIRKAKGVE